MKTIILDVLNPIETRFDHQHFDLIKPLLSWSYEYWKDGPYHKIRKEITKNCLTEDRDGYYFYTGFLTRIKKALEEQGHTVQVNVGDLALPVPYDDFIMPPNIENFDPLQWELEERVIKAAVEKQRGILVAPTGIGKTVIGLTVISAFRSYDFLWLCHTKDLMYQAYEEAKGWNLFDVGMLGDKHSDLKARLLISTRQSFMKYLDSMMYRFDGILIDEVHHVSGFEGEYADILRSVDCPLRFGLTAYLSKKKAEGWLAAEGLIGPVIESISVKEAIDKGILAKPRIHIIGLPKNKDIEFLSYGKAYDIGVVHNAERTKIITELAKKHLDRNESVLIFVTKREHGQLLADHLYDDAEIDNIEFIFGDTKGIDRLNFKKEMKTKDRLCVVANVVWFEGINIPSLNVIIDAATSRSDSYVFQKVGRGLRKTKDKSELILYDFFDSSHKSFVEHFGERVSIYCENGWL